MDDDDIEATTDRQPVGMAVLDSCLADVGICRVAVGEDLLIELLFL